MNEQDSLTAAIHEEVALHEPDAAWPSLFALEQARLQSILPGVFIDIQHVGSTAVAGLIAKPIIDILAGVESMRVADAVVASLCQAGYTTSADFNSTLTDRRWLMRWANGHRTHHLHVVVHESPAWFERLCFRDALRASPALAAQYAQLKRQLAAAHSSDREAYTNAKTAFVLAASKGD